MLIVGSSIAIAAIAVSGFSASAMVSLISNPSIPTIAHIFRQVLHRLFTFAIPSKSIKSFILDLDMVLSRFINAAGMFVLMCL